LYDFADILLLTIIPDGGRLCFEGISTLVKRVLTKQRITTVFDFGQEKEEGFRCSWMNAK